MAIKHVSIFKHPEKVIWTFEYRIFSSINYNEKQWFNILFSFSIKYGNTKWKHNGIGSNSNDSVINRDMVNLILGYPSHRFTNLYCRYQLTDKEKIEHLTVSWKIEHFTSFDIYCLDLITLTFEYTRKKLTAVAIYIWIMGVTH